MAPFSTYISFLFLVTLLFPLQIIARESHFFSKVPHSNNNVKDTELPKKEEPEKKPEEQPVFIPETDENSYGLYGHENTQNPSTISNYEPYETEFQHSNKYPNNDAFNTNQNEEQSNTRLSGNYRNSNKNNNYNKDAYDSNQNELSERKYTEGEYNSMGNQHNYKKHYYNSNNNAANNMYNGEKQGMSDTRFLEGGKYFYDLNYEKYNPTFYGDDSSRGVNTHNNWYNNRGNNYYGRNNGYQNQEEFDEDEQEFQP